MDLAEQPIGIFDSGIGGLTTAHALVKLLPNENIIYFGDTAHMPYGEKSSAAIQAYAIKIAQVFLQLQCKLILVACYSATAAAYELVKEYINGRALVVNVVDPTVRHLKAQYDGKHIGLIGTRQTVNSNIHLKKLNLLQADIRLTSYATSLLAAAIEEFAHHPLIDHLLEVYLAHPQLQGIDALVLACTHYPIVQEKIARYYQYKIDIIDASSIVAQAVRETLTEHQLLNRREPNIKHFYVSDYTESFANNAKLFFGESISLEHYPLWD